MARKKSSINRAEFIRDQFSSNPNITFQDVLAAWKEAELPSNEAPGSNQFYNLRTQLIQAGKIPPPTGWQGRKGKGNPKLPPRARKEAPPVLQPAGNDELRALEDLLDEVIHQARQLQGGQRVFKLNDLIDTLRNARKILYSNME